MVICSPFVDNYNFTSEGETFSGVATFTCSGRRWTIGEAISPVGMQWNFFPRRKTQVFFEGHGGYMYSTQQIPIAQSGSFNFTFDLGAGFEVYRSESAPFAPNSAITTSLTTAPRNLTRASTTGCFRSRIASDSAANSGTARPASINFDGPEFAGSHASLNRSAPWDS